MLLIGAHLARSGQMLSELITQLIHIRGNALQIFLSPNRGGRVGKVLSNLEVATANEMCKDGNFYLIVHGKYSINFCRPRAKITEWQYKSLIHDLTEAAKIGADVIIHQGKNMDEIGHPDLKTAMAVYANNLEQVLDATSQLTNKIILENSCQQGSEIGFTIDQLAQIYDLIGAEYRNRIGFCIDLCHIFVAGAVDLRDPEIVEEMFQEFDKKIGLAKLTVIHFNDSKISLAGCNDSHQDLMVGWVGNPDLGGGETGFQRVVEWAEKLSIPMILETPRDLVGAKEQISLVRSWSKGNRNEKVAEVYLKKTIEARSSFAEAAKITAANKSKSKGKNKGKVKSTKTANNVTVNVTLRDTVSDSVTKVKKLPLPQPTMLDKLLLPKPQPVPIVKKEVTKLPAPRIKPRKEL